MNAQLRVTINQQMHMIGHDLQTYSLRLVLLADFTNDLLSALCHALNQHLTPIFGTPHNVIFARVGNVAIGFVSNLVHTKHYTARCYLMSSNPLCPSPQGTPLISPALKGRGFTRPLIKGREQAVNACSHPLYYWTVRQQ